MTDQKGTSKGGFGFSSGDNSTDTFLKRFRIIDKIGEGSYSEVLKCENRESGVFIASKRLKHVYKSWNQVNDIAEVTTLRTLARHPHILQMLEIHYDLPQGKVSLVFEIMDMNLYELVKDRQRLLPERTVRLLMLQLLRAIRHLHKHGVFHRDIKPENVLIRSKTHVLKLGDLGSVRGIWSRPPFTEYISTRWYRSPECLLTAGSYGFKMDIWAAGCVFYEILTLQPLFPGSSEIDQISRIHNVMGPPPQKTLQKFFKQIQLDTKVNRSKNQQNRRNGLRSIIDEYRKRCEYSEGKSKNFDWYHGGKENGGLERKLPSYMSVGSKELIQMMLTYDPEARPTAHRLLQHPYFNDVRDFSVPDSEIIKTPIIAVFGDEFGRSMISHHYGHVDLKTLGDKKHMVQEKPITKQIVSGGTKKPPPPPESLSPVVDNNANTEKVAPHIDKESSIAKIETIAIQKCKRIKDQGVTLTNDPCAKKTPLQLKYFGTVVDCIDKESRGSQIVENVAVQKTKGAEGPGVVTVDHYPRQSQLPPKCLGPVVDRKIIPAKVVPNIDKESKIAQNAENVAAHKTKGAEGQGMMATNDTKKPPKCRIPVVDRKVIPEKVVTNIDKEARITQILDNVPVQRTKAAKGQGVAVTNDTPPRKLPQPLKHFSVAIDRKVITEKAVQNLDRRTRVAQILESVAILKTKGAEGQGVTTTKDTYQLKKPLPPPRNFRPFVDRKAIVEKEKSVPTIYKESKIAQILETAAAQNTKGTKGQGLVVNAFTNSTCPRNSSLPLPKYLGPILDRKVIAADKGVPSIDKEARIAQILGNAAVRKTNEDKGQEGVTVSYDTYPRKTLGMHNEEAMKNRTKRIRAQLKDDVYCSSDDDIVSTMRQKLDLLISERARGASDNCDSQIAKDLNTFSQRFRSKRPRKLVWNLATNN